MKEEKLKIKVNKKILIPFVIGFIATLLLLIFIFNKPGSIDTLEEISYPHTVKTSYGLIEKDYDSKAELISLSKTDTKENLAQIKLNTPRINYVEIGYQKVAEIEFTAYEDFKQYLSNSYFELYNVRDMKPIERHLDFKYWTTAMVEVEDYFYDCIEVKIEKNVTEKCTQKLIGTHLEEREVWKDISEMRFKSAEPIRIGIFTDVQVGDKVEWIPTLYGVEIKEWAVWYALALKYTGFENNAINRTDADGITWGYSKVGNDDAVPSAFIETGTVLNGTYSIKVNSTGTRGGLINRTAPAFSNHTISFWVNSPKIGDAGSLDLWSSTNRNGTYTSFALQQLAGDACPTGVICSYNGSAWASSAYNYSANTWQRMIIMVNATGTSFFYNNATAKIRFIAGVTTLGTWTLQDKSGYFDNVAICAGQDFNCGMGTDEGLEITLLSPANAYESTTTSVDFSANISDPSSEGIQNVSLLINGAINDTNTSTLEGLYNWTVIGLTDGNYNYTVIAYNDDNVSSTASNGTLNFSVDTAPTIYIVSPPANNSNFTDMNVDFEATSSLSVEYWIVNFNGTNYTTPNQEGTTLLESYNVPDGTYRLLLYGNNSYSGVWGLNDTIYFSVNTAPNFTVNLPTNTSYTSNTISFDIISTQDLDYLIINYNGTNLTISESLGTYTWHDSLTIEDGFHHLLIYGRNEESGVWGLWDDDLYFTVDATPPIIDVTFPNETIAFHEINTNLSLNWTVTDDNLDECWYNWNGTNVTVTCGDEHANINITVGTNTNLTFYANDTLGNEASDSVSWAYLIFYNYETYDDEVLEGTSTTFTANLLTNGSVINLVYLNYDGTNYTGTITNHGSNNFTLSRTLTAPLVAADDTLDFYWFIYQGAFTTKLDTNTQDVVKFLIDNCTTNTVVLYNFTIRDEASQTIINRTANDTQGKVDLQVYGFGTTTLIAQYNKSYSQINPFAVCINSSLASGEQFNVYALIEYKATNYSTEFYNIQNATINSTLLNQNISLFDLHQTVTQAFKLIVKDSSFLAISDALVEVHRKYIDEGDYKIVELPKTDGKGESTASLVVNDVIYKFIIKKYGVTIATFDNVRAICQTPIVTTCSIDFNAYASSITIPDFEEEEDFNFTIEYNASSRIVRSVFTIPSGVPATIKLQVNKTDALGTSVCEDTLTSTSGTLSCVVPNTIGNSTVVAKIYRDGDLQAFGQIKLDQSPSDIYGGVLVALALFIMLTLLGAGMSDNPVFTVLFFMLGIILLFALNLVGGGGFIGASATILWLIIAIIIVIIKGGNRS